MPVLTIELHNYKQHKDEKIILNGNSAILMGDIKTGKSNVMKVALAHLGLTDYPTNPLSDDENEGDVKTTHLASNGLVYTIQRKFKRDPETGEVTLDRLWVYPPSGSRSSLDSMKDVVFGGAFKNGFFDYIEYFYKNKSAVTRGAYFIKAIGGAEVEANVSNITKWKRERGVIGTEKDQKKAIFSHVNYNPETFDDDHLYYSQERVATEEAEAKKHAFLKDNLKDVEKLAGELDAQRAIMQNVENLKTKVALYDTEIDELEHKLKVLKENKQQTLLNITAQKNELLPAKKFEKLLSNIKNADSHNTEIERQASKVYSDAIEEVITFRDKKSDFFSGLEAYDEWEQLEAKWNELDKKITDTAAKNEEIFRSRIPIPELTIGEEDGKPIILYKGKEFSEDNLSTGERLAITTAIQQALNPEGDNFIIVPEAQSLGSELDLVLNELDKHGVQYLVEMTYPDQDFKVEIIERKADGNTE